MSYGEAKRAGRGSARADYYQKGLERSKKWREEYKKRQGIVKPEEMPWEECAQGRIKHVVNEAMNTRECALDMYMQFLEPGGCSGKHRHLAEELFYVLEGKGYDLHWDVKFDCNVAYSWDWETEPKRFEWEEGDFVYIPPYSMHQHFAHPGQPARLITASNRLLRALGFDWAEQVEPAPGNGRTTKK